MVLPASRNKVFAYKVNIRPGNVINFATKQCLGGGIAQSV
jgi:hypothetical protein